MTPNSKNKMNWLFPPMASRSWEGSGEYRCPLTEREAVITIPSVAHRRSAIDPPLLLPSLTPVQEKEVPLPTGNDRSLILSPVNGGEYFWTKYTGGTAPALPYPFFTDKPQHCWRRPRHRLLHQRPGEGSHCPPRSHCPTHIMRYNNWRSPWSRSHINEVVGHATFHTWPIIEMV